MVVGPRCVTARLLAVVGSLLVFGACERSNPDDDSEQAAAAQSTEPADEKSASEEPNSKEDVTRESGGEQFDSSAIRTYPEEAPSPGDLYGRSLRELSLIRNTPYARHGYEFNTDWLDDYFRNRDWYEPGDWEEADLTERDTAIAEAVREFEESMSLENLEARARLHWRRQGREHDGDFNPRGMSWPNMKAAVEASLLHDAISERRNDNGEQEYRDWPPREIPGGFGEVKLGDAVEEGSSLWKQTDDARRRFDQYRADLPVEPVDDERSTHVLTVPDGTVELLAATFSTRGWTPPAAADFEPFERRLIDLYGEPDDYGELTWNVYDDFEPMVWRSGNRVLEIRPQYGCCSEMVGLLVLGVGHPGRVCGRKDGFDAWFDDFRDATDAADIERLTKMMGYPLDRTSVPGVVMDPRDPIPDRQAFREILEKLRKNAEGEFPFRPRSHEGEVVEPTCDPTLGYVVLLDHSNSSYYELRVRRVDGEWMGTGLDYHP